VLLAAPERWPSLLSTDESYLESAGDHDAEQEREDQESDDHGDDRRACPDSLVSHARHDHYYADQ
jgi:hypothetical protein